MMESLLAANRSEKDSFRFHSVQQSIPIRRIFTDGIRQDGRSTVKHGVFDINYAASSLDDRRSIFRSYGAVLNCLLTDATAKIKIINRRLNPVDGQRTMPGASRSAATFRLLSRRKKQCIILDSG